MAFQDMLWSSPSSWGISSCCCWLAYLSRRGTPLGLWDKRQLAWGLASAVCFLYYLQFDRSFQVGVLPPVPGSRCGRNPDAGSPDSSLTIGARPSAGLGRRVLLLRPADGVLHLRLQVERIRVGQGHDNLELRPVRRAGRPAARSAGRPARPAARWVAPPRQAAAHIWQAAGRRGTCRAVLRSHPQPMGRSRAPAPAAAAAAASALSCGSPCTPRQRAASAASGTPSPA
jgi:hypothetical protein